MNNAFFKPKPIHKNKKLITVDFPDEFFGKKIEEVDIMPWLNDMLAEGKQFCGFTPGGYGCIKNAIFIVDT